MRQSKCESCGLTAPYAGRFIINDKIYCEPCANKLVEQLKSTKAPMRVVHAVDPTVCAKCSADNGNSEFGKVGNAPFCAACTLQLYNRPYPAWLRYSMVGMLALLVVALIHGIPYFKTGK